AADSVRRGPGSNSGHLGPWTADTASGSKRRGSGRPHTCRSVGGTAPWGLLAAGSRQTDGPELLERRMSTLVEFGALAVALIGPALSTRNLDDVVRQELVDIMEREAFSPVFQPIVALADRSPSAFEALTRFRDGSPPDRRFVEAESVGMSLRLEAATLTLALKSL